MKLVFAALALAAILVVGCAGPSGPPRPPTIRYGVDLSNECGMIIDDPRFAVAALPEKGDPLLFDDLGDFLAYRQAHQPKLSAVFVHDYTTKEWLPAQTAWYVASPKIVTPMNAGLASFADQAGARAQQSVVGGQVLDWSGVLASR